MEKATAKELIIEDFIKTMPSLDFSTSDVNVLVRILRRRFLFGRNYCLSYSNCGDIANLDNKIIADPIHGSLIYTSGNIPYYSLPGDKNFTFLNTVGNNYKEGEFISYSYPNGELIMCRKRASFNYEGPGFESYYGLMSKPNSPSTIFCSKYDENNGIIAQYIRNISSLDVENNNLHEVIIIKMYGQDSLKIMVKYEGNTITSITLPSGEVYYNEGDNFKGVINAIKGKYGIYINDILDEYPIGFEQEYIDALKGLIGRSPIYGQGDEVISQIKTTCRLLSTDDTQYHI